MKPFKPLIWIVVSPWPWFNTCT